MDNGFLVYAMNEIKKSKNGLYIMHNGELAKEFLPYVKEKYPDTKMVELETTQYFIVNEVGKKKLLEIMRRCRENLEEKINVINRNIKNLGG